MHGFMTIDHIHGLDGVAKTGWYTENNATYYLDRETADCRKEGLVQ